MIGKCDSCAFVGSFLLTSYASVQQWGAKNIKENTSRDQLREIVTNQRRNALNSANGDYCTGILYYRPSQPPFSVARGYLSTINITISVLQTLTHLAGD